MKADNLAGAAAARWLRLPDSERRNAGLMAPSHELRERINEIIRERLDGTIAGRAMEVERLVSLGYTRALLKALANKNLRTPATSVPSAVPTAPDKH